MATPLETGPGTDQERAREQSGILSVIGIFRQLRPPTLWILVRAQGKMALVAAFCL